MVVVKRRKEESEQKVKKKMRLSERANFIVVRDALKS